MNNFDNSNYENQSLVSEGANNYNDIGRRWYELFSEHNNSGPIDELKPNELTELQNKAKQYFENESLKQLKNNPSDAKWLQTALHKGTSRDKANAGALLVQSNPLPNLSTLSTLIGFSKIANHNSADVVDVLTELFINSLIPSDRKLMPITHRGTDWKNLQNNKKVDNKHKDKVLAYWYYENELKEHYFEFLKNLQQAIQSGKDSTKSKSIISVTKLLCYGPEKEQMLLSMLINKLGDPVKQVAGKALYHALEVAYKHPNMCGVITNETEKLLFRPNISEKAQHFALCFLAQIASHSNPDVCTKLVQICFSFFKIYVEKGEVNNKIMQAILLCLRRSIVDAKCEDNTELIPKETLDTIYRVIHIAELQISIQSLCVLLQVMTVKTDKYDRYYTALYKKLLDPNLAFLGTKPSSLFFYVIHRSISMDKNIPRCQAMLKRLLQIALYFPPPKICATLIVIDKLLKSRAELRFQNLKIKDKKTNLENKNNVKNHIFEENDHDDDEEERYEDAKEEIEESNLKSSKQESEIKMSSSSWVHLNYKNNSKTSSVFVGNDRIPTCYDYKARNPMYAGAEYSIQTELLSFANHFHPSVKLFAENLVYSRPINYKGNPLNDFSLTYFLERFSFRNPKKILKKETDKSFLLKMFKEEKEYRARGSRGQPVRALTETNCTEDERYIFQFLDKKRSKKPKKDDDEESTASLDDDEFDEYLNSLTGSVKNKQGSADFLNEINMGMTKKNEKKKKGKANEESEEDDMNSDEENNEDLNEFADDDEFGSDDGSISLDDGDDVDSDVLLGDGSNDSFSDFGDTDNENDGEFDEEEYQEPTSKKSKLSSKKPLNAKEFNKKIKNSDDMSSLFASADAFAEMLEDSGTSKKHGTLSEVFNKDKSSDKQLQWEDKRNNKFSFNKKFKNKRNNTNLKKKPARKSRSSK